MRQGRIVGVEPRIEKFAHPGLDHVGKLAGHDDQRFALRHKNLLKPRLPTINQLEAASPLERSFGLPSV